MRVSLYDTGLLKGPPFSETAGGDVTCKVKRGGGIVTVEMGKVSFSSKDIPLTGPTRDVLNGKNPCGWKNVQVLCGNGR